MIFTSIYEISIKSIEINVYSIPKCLLTLSPSCRRTILATPLLVCPQPRALSYVTARYFKTFIGAVSCSASSLSYNFVAFVYRWKFLKYRGPPLPRGGIAQYARCGDRLPISGVVSRCRWLSVPTWIVSIGGRRGSRSIPPRYRAC